MDYSMPIKDLKATIDIKENIDCNCLLGYRLPHLRWLILVPFTYIQISWNVNVLHFLYHSYIDIPLDFFQFLAIKNGVEINIVEQLSICKKPKSPLVVFQGMVQLNFQINLFLAYWGHNTLLFTLSIQVFSATTMNSPYSISLLACNVIYVYLRYSDRYKLKCQRNFVLNFLIG